MIRRSLAAPPPSRAGAAGAGGVLRSFLGAAHLRSLSFRPSSSPAVPSSCRWAAKASSREEPASSARVWRSSCSTDCSGRGPPENASAKPSASTSTATATGPTERLRASPRRAVKLVIPVAEPNLGSELAAAAGCDEGRGLVRGRTAYGGARGGRPKAGDAAADMGPTLRGEVAAQYSLGLQTRDPRIDCPKVDQG
jgi:hypothetical protein